MVPDLLAGTPLALCAAAARNAELRGAELERCVFVFERSNVVEQGVYWLVSSFTLSVGTAIGMGPAMNMGGLGYVYRVACAAMMMSSIYVTLTLALETYAWAAAHSTDSIETCSLSMAPGLAVVTSFCGLWHILFPGEAPVERDEADEKAMPLLHEDGLPPTGLQ